MRNHCRAVDVDALLQASETIEPGVGAALPRKRVDEEAQRQPDVGGPPRESHAGRHDAGNREGLAVQRQGQPDDVGARRKAVSPQPLADDRDARGARLIVARVERASRERCDAHRREDRRGHEAAVQALGRFAKFGLVEAATALAGESFEILPYTTEDLSAAERLVAAGCTVLMPWAAPIGSARGLINKEALKTLRAYFPDIPLIVDAGLGAPSHAAEVMELGYDAVLLNTAVAKAADPVKMAAAFARAVEAGRLAFEAGLIEPRDMASPSTPVAGTPFFKIDHAS